MNKKIINLGSITFGESKVAQKKKSELLEEIKNKNVCDNCNGDGVTYTEVNKQNINDPFSLAKGIYEDECTDCDGFGFYQSE